MPVRRGRGARKHGALFESKYNVVCALPSQPDIVSLFDSADDVLAGFLEQNTWMLQFAQTNSQDSSDATTPLPPSPLHSNLASTVPKHFISPKTALTKLKVDPNKPNLSRAEYAGARCTVLTANEADCLSLGVLLSQLVSGHLVTMICSDFSSYIALQYRPDNLTDRFSKVAPSWNRHGR